MKIKLKDNFETTIDVEKFEEISSYKWYLTKCDSNFYVCRYIKSGNKYIKMYLHRFLLNASKGQIVDHINGNTLDNRLCNLRLATAAENNRNSKISKSNKSGYKGIYYNKLFKKYIAQITVNYKGIYLGAFKTKEEAALRYNEAALEYFGEFALLNKVIVND